MINTVECAKNLATELLKDNPLRLQHVQGVVATMDKWLDYLDVRGEEYDTHMMIAWLHDIGYSDLLNVANFHALDGYNYLLENGWKFDVCVGVLVHSFSYELAALTHPTLTRCYGTKKQVECIQRNPSIFTHITLVDLHTLPTGDLVTFEQRRADILKRYGNTAVHIYEISDTLNQLKLESGFNAFLKKVLAK